MGSYGVTPSHRIGDVCDHAPKHPCIWSMVSSGRAVYLRTVRSDAGVSAHTGNNLASTVPNAVCGAMPSTYCCTVTHRHLEAPYTLCIRRLTNCFGLAPPTPTTSTGLPAFAPTTAVFPTVPRPALSRLSDVVPLLAADVGLIHFHRTGEQALLSAQDSLNRCARCQALESGNFMLDVPLIPVDIDRTPSPKSAAPD